MMEMGLGEQIIRLYKYHNTVGHVGIAVLLSRGTIKGESREMSKRVDFVIDLKGDAHESNTFWKY